MEFFPLLEKRSEINRMLNAAFHGDLHLFKRLAHELDDEVDLVEKIVSSKDENGGTALHVAAFGGRTHILKYLIDELKLDVNDKDDEGPKKLFQLLISKGSEVDANNLDAGTPLQRAAALGKEDSVKVLLENNANPNMYSYHTLCPLVSAINNGSMECVKLLLQAGADPNVTCRVLKPLDVAVSKGDIEIIKCLLDAGAGPNVPNYGGLTPIEVAAAHENRDAVMTLYPITTPISNYPDWSVDGIMVHTHSEEMTEKKRQKMEQDFMVSKSKGTEAAKRMEYHDAIEWYTKAVSWNDMDATLFSNRSLCRARLGDGNNACVDAKMCVQLSPFWPKSYYRLGVAWMLLKKFEKAADAFRNGLKLDRENKELDRAFR